MVESQKRSYEVQFCTDLLEKKFPMEMLNILPVGGRGKGLIAPKTSLVKPTIFNSFRNIVGRGHFYNKSLNNDFKEYDRNFISSHVESIRQDSNIHSVDKVNICAGVSMQAEKTRQQITSNIINISDDLEKQLKKKPICLVESNLKNKCNFDNNGFGTSRHHDFPSPGDNPVTSNESSIAFSMQKIITEGSEKKCYPVNVSLHKKEDVSVTKVLTTTENFPEVIEVLDEGASESSTARKIFHSGEANICDKSDPDTRSTNRKLSMTTGIDNHPSIHVSTCSIYNRIKSEMEQSECSINTDDLTENTQSKKFIEISHCSADKLLSDCEAQQPCESSQSNIPEKLQIEDVIINDKQPKFTLTRNFSSEGFNNHSKPGSPIIAEISITKKICNPLLVNRMYYNDKEYLKTLHEKDLFLVIEHIASSVIDEVEQMIKSFGNLVLFLVEPDILHESESFSLVKMSESSECEFVVSCLDGYIWGMKRLKVRRVVDILEA